ncbi:MAG: oligosaccharide flippase family protein, partial [Methanomicrobiales archaeon]|nr:oligosaccharide flippase family protein [Methanomicrobiales archaeon]
MILVGGTTVTQVLSILASPVLTRLFGPEAFGLSALFVSITSIISVFVCLRYELAIMLPETEEDAVNLVGVSIFAVILITLLTIPVSYFGSTAIALWLNAPELGAYMWLVPPSTFLSGLFLALNYWNTRTRQFGRLANVRVAGAVATTGSQIGAGIAGFTSAGVLIGGSILGSFISTFVLMVQVWRDDSHLFRKGLHWQRMKQGIIRYRNFPLFDSWAALLNSVSTSLPFFLLSIYFSPAIVGFYSLGNRILKLPLGFIGSSINQVFYQRAAEAKHKGDEALRALSHAIFLRLAVLGSYPIFLLMVIGQEVFVVVFGGNWAEA